MVKSLGRTRHETFSDGGGVGGTDGLELRGAGADGNGVSGNQGYDADRLPNRPGRRRSLHPDQHATSHGRGSGGRRRVDNGRRSEGEADGIVASIAGSRRKEGRRCAALQGNGGERDRGAVHSAESDDTGEQEEGAEEVTVGSCVAPTLVRWRELEWGTRMVAGKGVLRLRRQS